MRPYAEKLTELYKKFLRLEGDVGGEFTTNNVKKKY
jgi:hypothetical protein